MNTESFKPNIVIKKAKRVDSLTESGSCPKCFHEIRQDKGKRFGYPTKIFLEDKTTHKPLIVCKNCKSEVYIR